MRKLCLILLYSMGTVTTVFSAVIWHETTQTDFADGYIDPSLYASWRTYMESDPGCVEWYARFDLDGNGTPDFAAPMSTERLRVLFMNGRTLMSSLDLVSDGQGGDCEFVDLNTDGRPEIVHAAYDGVSKIYWNSSGTFSDANVTLFPDEDSEAIFVADLDKDGFLDLIIGGNIFRIRWGEYSAIRGWDLSSAYYEHDFGYVNHNIECADFDNDGDLDITFTMQGGTAAYYFLENLGTRAFTIHEFPSPMGTQHGTSVGDLNNDGLIDVVFTATLTPPSNIFTNTGSFTFSTVSVSPGDCYGGTSLYDFTRDGYMDIIYFRGHSAVSPLIYPNDGTGHFSDATRYAASVFTVNASSGTVIDVDNDGEVDIFVNDNSANSYVMWGPDFATRTILTASASHHGVFREPGNIRDRSPSSFYLSNVFDVGDSICSGTVSWTAYDERDYISGVLPDPIGTECRIFAHTGDTPSPDASWTPWVRLTDDSALPSLLLYKQFIQYRAELWYQNVAFLPWLEEITFMLDTCGTFSIDSLWLWEETNCDNVNTVRICYTLSDDSASIAIAMSSDGGVTWNVPLTTLSDTAGDLGAHVAPGTHCFNWHASTDLPNVEGIFTARIITSDTTDVCCSGADFIRTNGTIPNMLLLGHFTGMGYEADPAINYLAGDVVAGKTWFIDSTDTHHYEFGIDFYGMIFFNRRYIDWSSPGHCYTRFSICSPVDTSVVMHLIADDDIIIWRNGVEIYAEHSGSVTIYDLPISFSAGEWNSFCVWLYNSSVNLHQSIWFTTPSGIPVNSLKYTLTPTSTSTVDADTLYATAPVDTRPPRINITCPPSPLSSGDSVRFFWTVDDMFESTNAESLIVNVGGTVSRYLISDTTYRWTVPNTCDTIRIIVAARDSFCNWGRDTCALTTCPSLVVPLLCPTMGYTACEDQGFYAVLIENLCFSIIDTMRTYFTLGIHHRDGTSSSQMLYEPSANLDFHVSHDSTYIFVHNLHLISGDSVSIRLDSVFTIGGCRTTIPH